MAEETETTEVEETTEQETTTEPKALDFLEPDGTFKDGWVEALTPEDFRTPADKLAYDSVNGLKSVLKQLAHQNRTIQKQGKGVMPLGKEPTATEVELYRAAMGIPETPEGYEVGAPEGLADYYDEGALKDFAKMFHDANLTPAQAKAVMALDEKRIRAGIEEAEAAEAAAADETEAALRKEWGTDFEPNMRLANRVVAETVPQEMTEEILATIGNDANVVKLFAKLGEAFLEDKVVSTDEERPSSLTSEIERLQATPGYANGELRRTNRKEHDRIVARLAVLYGRKFPEPAPTT